MLAGVIMRCRQECPQCGAPLVAVPARPAAARPSSVIAAEPMWSPASDRLYRDPKDGASW